MIHFVQTGGTIDKDYTPTEKTHGYNFDISTPAYDEIVARLYPELSFTGHTLYRKDSLDITDDDRQALARYVESVPYDKIVITHGTDTMEKSARSIAAGDKAIVFTGAMKPHRFKDSDAEANVGMAIGVVQVAKPGVYLVLEGTVRRLK